jgi:hypothetical protein
MTALGQNERAGAGGYVGPGRYRHYKGGEYEVLGFALHESELYRLVIYRPLTPRATLQAYAVMALIGLLGVRSRSAMTRGIHIFILGSSSVELESAPSPKYL